MTPAEKRDRFPAGLPWRPSPPLQPAASIVALMTRLITATRPNSDAEALRLLREAFPDYPLSVRLAALAAGVRRMDLPQVHIPR